MKKKQAKIINKMRNMSNPFGKKGSAPGSPAGSKSILVGKELQQLKNLVGEESRFDYTEEEFSSMNRDRRILLRFQEK